MVNVRRDIETLTKLSGLWSPTIEWYAKAVKAMSARPVTDRTSWRYLAAVHGVVLAGAPATWITKGVITAAEALPPKSEQLVMWDQCQHSSWYFLPWHRGYLAAFEAIVAKTIVDLGGPPDWALPYWNYFDSSNPGSRRFPQAFMEQTLADGSTPNPLAAFVRNPAEQLAAMAAFGVPDISLSAMGKSRFTANPGANGFGGAPSGFQQFAPQQDVGALESDPHNLVHVMVGGLGPASGFMTDPDFAALDPLFWLHHCNIDRLWAAWLTNGSNVQENGKAWLDGPSPRQFQMPAPDGTLHVFTPAQCLPGNSLAPQYDDLWNGTAAVPSPLLPPVAPAAGAGPGPMPAAVMSGHVHGGALMTARMSGAPGPMPTLLASNDRSLKVGVTPVVTRLALPASAMSGVGPAARLRVRLEGISGSAPSGVISVGVGVPAAATQPAAAPRAAGSAILFGLAKASRQDGAHAGNGLTASVDITDIVRQLTRDMQKAPTDLEIQLAQPTGASYGDVDVAKVSIISHAGD